MTVPIVTTLRNPKALLLSNVEMLLRSAVAATPGAAPDGFDSIAKELYDCVVRPNRFLLLGWEDDLPRAVAMVALPSSTIFPNPYVALFYCEGSPALRRALSEACCDTISQAGFASFQAINETERSLAVWLRALGPKGTKVRKVGELVEFTIEGADERSIPGPIRREPDNQQAG